MSKESKRRSFFGRSSLGALAGLQSSRDDSEPANLLRKRRTASLLTTLSTSSHLAVDEPLDGATVAGSPVSLAPTPVSRGSGSRMSAAFGSFKGIRLADDAEEPLSATSTRSTVQPGGFPPADETLRKSQVLHYGEVQTSSSMFRKKKEYLVLTETHLIRFKSHQKAAEAFSAHVAPPFISSSELTAAEFPRPSVAYLRTDTAKARRPAPLTNSSRSPRITLEIET